MLIYSTLLLFLGNAIKNKLDQKVLKVYSNHQWLQFKTFIYRFWVVSCVLSETRANGLLFESATGKKKNKIDSCEHLSIVDKIAELYTRPGKNRANYQSNQSS